MSDTAGRVTKIVVEHLGVDESKVVFYLLRKNQTKDQNGRRCIK